MYLLPLDVHSLIVTIFLQFKPVLTRLSTAIIWLHPMQLCETYSSNLYVPATVDNSVIMASAKFRSKERLPILSYYHNSTQVLTELCSTLVIQLSMHKN